MTDIKTVLLLSAELAIVWLLLFFSLLPAPSFDVDKVYQNPDISPPLCSDQDIFPKWNQETDRWTCGPDTISFSPYKSGTL